jgi:hypothetical protein
MTDASAKRTGPLATSKPMPSPPLSPRLVGGGQPTLLGHGPLSVTALSLVDAALISTIGPTGADGATAGSGGRSTTSAETPV